MAFRLVERRQGTPAGADDICPEKNAPPARAADLDNPCGR